MNRTRVRAFPSLGAVVLAAVMSTGCGEGERMETGTQAQVTDEMKREAMAGDKFLTEQAKAKKSSSKRATDAREPGAAP